MKPLLAALSSTTTIGLFVIAAFVFGTSVFGAGVARADDMDTYVNANGPDICRILDNKGVNLTVFASLAAAVQIDGGFSAYQAGRVIGYSVLDYCPEYYDPIMSLMNKEPT